MHRSLAMYQRSLTLVLLSLFIVSVLLGGTAMAYTLQQNVRRHYIDNEAQVLIEMMNSVRDYTSTGIKPALTQQPGSGFAPESIPSYSAQQVFERLRQRSQYSRYSYKEAALNPTSLRDKADDFEQGLINQFRNGQRAIDEPISGIKETPRGQVFYSARALQVSKPACLQCHSTPDVAPAYITAHYGSKNGFGWQLNEIIGAQILYLPVAEFAQTNRLLLRRVMAVFIAVLGAVLVTVGIWLRSGRQTRAD